MPPSLINTPTQIVLDVALPDEQTFESFNVGENSVAVDHCKSLGKANVNREPVPFLTFVSGHSGSGKSHLLVATSHEAVKTGLPHFYLSLDDISHYPISILEGLEDLSLVCIDNVQCVEQLPEWQIGLFDLINRINEKTECKLLLSANKGPKQLDLNLADLASRLTWGVSFHLESLNDEQQVQALMVKAQQRGITIAEESIQFLVGHYLRDMHSLTQALTLLEIRSLQEKRKISVPLIKEVFTL